jgi:DNA-binding NarL/FixJ family response regulator
MGYKFLILVTIWSGFVLAFQNSSKLQASQQEKGRNSMFGDVVSSGSASPNSTHSGLDLVENPDAQVSSHVVSVTTMPCRIPAVVSMNDVGSAGSASDDISKEEIIKYLESQAELYKRIKASLNNAHEILCEVVKEGKKALAESESKWKR